MTSFTHQIIAQSQSRRRKSVTRVLLNRPIYKDLLSRAKKSIDSKSPQLSVIYAHAAMELCVESALSDLFKSSGVPNLEKPFSDLLRGFSLNNEKVRDVLNALTGRRIQDQDFWQEYREYKDLRNNIVHKGKKCSKEQASSIVGVANKVVSYVQESVKSKKA
jgi:HEPN domain-containing protein